MKVLSDIAKISKSSWRSFVLNHPEGQTFMMPEMVDFYSSITLQEPIVCVAEDECDDVLGVLVAIIIKDFKGLLGKFTSRSIILGGPLVKDNKTDVAEVLLSEYLNLVKSKAIYTQVRNLYDMRWMNECFIKHHFKNENHLDFIHNLTADKDAIVSSVNKNKRANIRKSVNKGTTFIEIKDYYQYLACIGLVRNTYKRLGLPCPTSDYFEKAFIQLSPSGLMHTFAAIFEGKIIGVRMELVCGGNIYDWYAGADDSESNKYPNDFLPYNIILWGTDNGYSRFDFGGAGKPGVPYGVREHKAKFGGQLVDFGRYEIVHKPFLMILGKIAFPVYKVFKKYI